MTIIILILWVLLWGAGILIATFALMWLCGFLFSFDFVPLSVKHILVKIFFPIVCFLLGVDLVVHNKQNIPRYRGKKGYAIIANHQSMFDILVIGSVFRDPVAFVAKKEISKWPFVGIWTKTLGSSFIDRDNLRQSYQAVMIKGVDNIKNGLAMTIFPAGTRSKKNEVQDFKPGSLRIATSSKAPIVPVTIIDGFKAAKAGFFHRVKVHVHIHPMLEAKDYDELSSFEIAKKVQTIVEQPIIELKK